MEHAFFIFEIEEEEANDLYTDIVSLEVEMSCDLANLVRIRIALMQLPDGTWKYLDDDRLKIWNKVAVKAGFGGSGPEELFFGYITQVKPYFDPDPSFCAIELLCMDSSILMDRSIITKDWVSMKDSEIAEQVFNTYHLDPKVEDTKVTHDEQVSTILQRETDIQFLRRLASRNGYECYVEGTNGYFRPPLPEESPQPLLAIHSREETNLLRFSIETNANVPGQVRMTQIDRLNKKNIIVDVKENKQKALGRLKASDFIRSGMDTGLYLISLQTATGNPEMTALCENTFQKVNNFVAAEGEVSGYKYGHILRNRKTVTIKGAGETYSGLYYVTQVTHRFTREGYTQVFKATRNGLGLTGSENFST